MKGIAHNFIYRLNISSSNKRKTLSPLNVNKSPIIHCRIIKYESEFYAKVFTFKDYFGNCDFCETYLFMSRKIKPKEIHVQYLILYGHDL
jgi:hypothetical protein